jgi:methylenetetrahydrofolate dehydrogenase (NADP+)/methenyltetrahydrofolate cyclohydrolase
MIDDLNHNPDVHGILVQLPLPKQIDSQAIIAAIDPDKDVDGFHPVNVGRLYTGLPSLVPCTPQGSMILLREAVPDLKGMKAIVLGRSNIVGKPVAQLLLQADCTVTIAHSRTRDLPGEVRAADIVVAAIGKPEFVQGDWIGSGAVVIDVGINRIDDPVNPGKSKLVGDVAFAAASQNAAAITPVPGGVGPMTIACLLKNTLQAAGIV